MSPEDNYTLYQSLYVAECLSFQRKEWICIFRLTCECLVSLLMRSVNEPFVHNMRPNTLSPKGNISSLKVISYLFPLPQSIHKDKHLTVCILQLIIYEIVLFTEHWFKIEFLSVTFCYIVICLKLTMWYKTSIQRLTCFFKFECWITPGITYSCSVLIDVWSFS